MADRSLRGMRLGGQSLQSEEGVIFSPRITHNYHCLHCGKDTQMIFSADAEAPDQWECRFCSLAATRMVGSELVDVAHTETKVPRSHWDMLLERRTREELEELLQERLTFLRARRGQSKIDA